VASISCAEVQIHANGINKTINIFVFNMSKFLFQ
jgi:hypothetical protein